MAAKRKYPKWTLAILFVFTAATFITLTKNLCSNEHSINSTQIVTNADHENTAQAVKHFGHNEAQLNLSRCAHIPSIAILPTDVKHTPSNISKVTAPIIVALFTLETRQNYFSIVKQQKSRQKPSQQHALVLHPTVVILS